MAKRSLGLPFPLITLKRTNQICWPARSFLSVHWGQKQWIIGWSSSSDVVSEAEHKPAVNPTHYGIIGEAIPVKLENTSLTLVKFTIAFSSHFLKRCWCGATLFLPSLLSTFGCLKRQTKIFISDPSSLIKWFVDIRPTQNSRGKPHPGHCMKAQKERS